MNIKNWKAIYCHNINSAMSLKPLDYVISILTTYFRIIQICRYFRVDLALDYKKLYKNLLMQSDKLSWGDWQICKFYWWKIGSLRLECDSQCFVWKPTSKECETQSPWERRKGSVSNAIYGRLLDENYQNIWLCDEPIDATEITITPEWIGLSFLLFPFPPKHSFNFKAIVCH